MGDFISKIFVGAGNFLGALTIIAGVVAIIMIIKLIILY